MQVNNNTLLVGHKKGTPGILYTSRLFSNLQGYVNNDSLWQTNIFGNIGAGIGIIFNKTYRANNNIPYASPMPSVWNWLNNNPSSETDVYKVRNFLTKMTNGKYKFQEGVWP